MEILIQVMEDRNYLDAQNGKPTTFNLAELSTIPDGTNKKENTLELEDRLKGYIHRGLFRKYLESVSQEHLLRAYDELQHIKSIPPGSQQYKLFQVAAFKRRYLTQNKKTFIQELFVDESLCKAIEQDDTEMLISRGIEVLNLNLNSTIPTYQTSNFFDYQQRFEWYSSKIMSEEDYTKLRVLGQGGFGKVHAIKKNDSGALYALKEMCKVKIVQKKRMNTVMNEARILMTNDHPFLVSLHHVFCNTGYIYMSLDLMLGGELKFHLKRGVQPELDLARFWVASLVSATLWLHNKNVMHRDIKPSNVLMDENGFLRITDFGLSLDISLSERLPSSCCGTPGFIAPEMYLGPHWNKKTRTLKEGASKTASKFFNKTSLSISRTKNKLYPANNAANSRSRKMTAIPNTSDFPRYKNYDMSVDWYALGVTIHQFYAFGKMPFAHSGDKSEARMLKEIIDGNIRWEDQRPPHNGKTENSHLTKEAKDFITRLLHHDPKKRLGANTGEVKNHPFLIGYDWEKLEKKLVVPPFRPNVSQVNAEYQESEYEEVVRSRRSIAKLVTEEDEAKFRKLQFTRVQTFPQEIIGSTLKYEPTVKQQQKTKGEFCCIS